MRISDWSSDVCSSDLGYLSYRSHIWSDTDPARTGMLPVVFEQGFGYERYADYMLDVPMYFVYLDGRYIDAAGLSFRDLLKGEFSILPSVQPTRDDSNVHLSTAFPDLLLQTFLEISGAGKRTHLHYSHYCSTH